MRVGQAASELQTPSLRAMCEHCVSVKTTLGETAVKQPRNAYDVRSLRKVWLGDLDTVKRTR